MILIQYPIYQNQITSNDCKSYFFHSNTLDTSFSSESQKSTKHNQQALKSNQQNIEITKDKMPEKCKQKYKTELCKNFMLVGKCKYGDLCCYAHGKQDLRQKIIQSDNYKKKVCKYYHQQGFCSYGARCQYYHFDSPTKFQILLKNQSEKTEIKFLKNQNFSLRKFLQKQPKLYQRLQIFQSKFKQNQDSSIDTQ